MLRRHPNPAFTCKAVYELWAKIDRTQWKRDNDEVKLAEILLEEFRSGKYNIPGLGIDAAAIPLKLAPEDNHVALAFVLPEALNQWSGRIREVLLDSACA